jgi:hypothetical protein
LQKKKRVERLHALFHFLLAQLLSTLHAVTANLKSGNKNVELAISFHLPFHAIKQIALELLHIPTTQTSHVHVISFWAALVEMPFAFHMQQVQLVHKSLPFEERKCPVNRNSIDVRIDLRGLSQNLSGVQMLLGGFNDLQDDSPLASESNTSRQQSGL